MEKVKTDKLREVEDGHDGTWVAHPALLPIAKEVCSDAVRENRMPVPRHTIFTVPRLLKTWYQMVWVVWCMKDCVQGLLCLAILQRALRSWRRMTVIPKRFERIGQPLQRSHVAVAQCCTRVLFVLWGVIRHQPGTLA